MLKEGFPKIIIDLPEADLGIKGAKGWIAQGKDHQIVFIEVESSLKEAEHSHDFPCWLIMVDGKMRISMHGKSEIYEKGDEVFFPAHVKHSAKAVTKSRGVVFISGKGLFKSKSTS